MKKLSLIFGGVFLLFLIGVVSASLCKGDDGYYQDCRDVNVLSSGYSDYSSPSGYNEKVILLNPMSSWEDDSDRYRQCLKDCDVRYRTYCRSYSGNNRCFLRDECYDSCTEKSSYSERVEYTESIKDLRDVYRESFESKYVLEDKSVSLYNNDKSEIVYLDKREYEYKKPLGYNYGKDVVYVYLPGSDYGGRDKVVYLNSNNAGYKYIHDDGSSWRYKEKYDVNDYQYCECDKWKDSECREWKCFDYNYDDYYYMPRMNFMGGYNWNW